MRGGLRSRLILDSTRITIAAGLADLGWFDPTTFDTPPGTRSHQPVHYLPKPTAWDEEVTLNSFAVSAEDISDDPIGLAGELEDTLRCYVDVFAQDEQFGIHFAADVRDILAGKMPSIGRTGPFINVFDLRNNPPIAFTTVEVADLRIDRAQQTVLAWQQYWYMIRFDLVDDYAEEYGAIPVGVWDSHLDPAWQRIQDAS